jgi:hypothetical protein
VSVIQPLPLLQVSTAPNDKPLRALPQLQDDDLLKVGGWRQWGVGAPFSCTLGLEGPGAPAHCWQVLLAKASSF